MIWQIGRISHANIASRLSLIRWYIKLDDKFRRYLGISFVASGRKWPNREVRGTYASVCFGESRPLNLFYQLPSSTYIGRPLQGHLDEMASLLSA